MITEGRNIHVTVDGPWADVSSDCEVIIHVAVDGPWAGWSYHSSTIIHVTVDGPWTGVRAQGVRLYHTSSCWRCVRLALLFCIACVFILVYFGLCLVFFVLWVLCSQFCLSHSLDITVTSMKKMLNLFCLFLIWENRDMSILWKLLWVKWKNENLVLHFFFF